MIISASRRSDIPAFHSKWFLSCLEKGFVDIANPRNPKQVKRVELTPEVVDCFVFWTKNAAPMLFELHRLTAFNYYFQYTVSGYDNDIEKNVPTLDERIDTFCKLSEIIGSRRIIWRYDPILFTPTYDFHFHIDSFEKIASSFQGFTQHCVISYVDMYPKIKRNMNLMHAEVPTREIATELSKILLAVAKNYGIKLSACCEPPEMLTPGIENARCIDAGLIASLTGKYLKSTLQKSLRPLCRCTPSIDIGTYDTCGHGCVYCYAKK